MTGGAFVAAKEGQQGTHVINVADARSRPGDLFEALRILRRSAASRTAPQGATATGKVHPPAATVQDNVPTGNGRRAT